MKRASTIAAAALAAIPAAAVADGPPKNYFNDTPAGLHFVTDEWSVRSRPPAGWVSLKAGEAEFLGAAAGRGGFAFRRAGKLLASFPDQGSISHDRQVGRVGYVADGTYMVRISPHWRRAEFELYAGYNDKAAHELIMLLGADVAFVRLGPIGAGGEERTWMRRVVRPGHKGLVRARGAVVVHKTGCALAVDAACRAGTVKDARGAERLALVFDTKGFAANTIRVIVEPHPRDENFVLAPQFRVRSSDDPAGNVHGATAGVVNPIYGRDTKLDFNIDFGWLKDAPFRGAVEVEIVHALGGRHFHERKALDAARPGKDGRITVHFEPKLSRPGVSDVWGRLLDADGRLIWVDRYRMAYDWEHYRPRLLVRPDMRAFWDATLAELRKRPLAPRTKRVFADHPLLEVSEVTFAGWGGRRICAMLFAPKARKRPLPAIVTAHPGTTGYGLAKGADGRYGSRIAHDLRFATIVPLIRGHKPDAKDIPFNHPWWGPLDSRDEYAARAWYCAMVRAIDYLATRRDLVDMKRVVALGGSQGGALALVTAALDGRVAYCFADCPANCQPHEIMRNYGSFGPSKGCVPAGQTLEQVERMLSYYNPVNFCPWIRCPTYVGSNIGDLTVHSMGPLAAYHNLTGVGAGSKAFHGGFTHAHGSGAGLGKKRQEVFRRIAGAAVKPAKR